MGRNAAFGRPQTHWRLLLWWHGMDRSSQCNLILAVVVGIISATLVGARLSRDPSGASSVTTTNRRPPTTAGALPTPSTVVIGDLNTPGPTVPPGEVPTTTTTVAAARTVPAPATTSTTRTTRPAPKPAPATTVPNPGVIFTEVPVPPPTTSRPVTTTPVITTPPTTAAPPTTAPTTTTTQSPVTTTPTTAAQGGPLQFWGPQLFGGN